MEDGALMQRVQAGDEPALATLMERWELPVKRVAARLVLNAAEAEDIAQETFVRVWQQRGTFRPGAEFRPWVFAIAVNLARNRLRWWRRRPVVSLDAWEAGGGTRAGDEGRRSEMKDEKEGRGVVEKNERAAVVRAAVAELSVELREAVVLFEYEQMSHAEIANAAGCSAKAVETRLYRARGILRKKLERELER
jgi:RNA polymerase sigma-70 factor (ECF subfamily)